MKHCVFKFVEEEHYFNINDRYTCQSIHRCLYFNEYSSVVSHVPVVLKLEYYFTKLIIWRELSKE